LSIWDAKAPLLLLHRSLKHVPDLPRYDLMLSPQFYVLKREELPVKYAFQAKKLAPSILEDLVGDGPVTYEVFRDEEGLWNFVAFDPDAVGHFLASRGGSLDRVGRFYFAEQARDHFEPPVVLSTSEVLGVVNGTVTVIPAKLLSDSRTTVSFDEAFRPEQGFAFKRSRKKGALDGRVSMAAAAVLLVLGLAYAAEGFRYQRALQQAKVSLENAMGSDPTLRGSYARDAIHKKYRAVDTTQRAVRERLKALGRLTSKVTKLDRLTITPEKYQAVMSVPDDPKIVRSLEELAKNGHLEGVKIASGKLETAGGTP